MTSDTKLAQRAITQLQQRGVKARADDIPQFESYIQEGYEDLKGSSGYEPVNDATMLARKAVALYAMKEYTGEPALMQEYEQAALRWSEAAAREVQGSRQQRRGEPKESSLMGGYR